jgi:hypothetical protein
MGALRVLRIAASFALLGALVAGALLGWFHLPFDPRAVGAGVGTLVGLVIAISHRSYHASPERA